LIGVPEEHPKHLLGSSVADAPRLNKQGGERHRSGKRRVGLKDPGGVKYARDRPRKGFTSVHARRLARIPA
jgi:hypothetical protein